MQDQAVRMRPYVQIACICQTIMQETNGAMSLIRITDRIGIAGVLPQMQPAPLQNLALVVVLKSGELRQTQKIRIVPVTPQGVQMPAMEMTALFEGDDRGVVIAIPVSIVVTEEGVYWFDVLVEEDLLTRIPLRVIYQRLPTVMPFQQPPPQPGN